MALEEGLRLATHGSDLAKHLQVLRAARLLRLARLLGILRVFAAFREFRLLMHTVQCGCRAAFLLLASVAAALYVVGVGLTEGTYEHCGDAGGHVPPVCLRFGGLGSSFLHLYQAAFGGILWGELLDGLGELDIPYSVLFVLSISFITVIALNTVTLVFLEMQAEAARTPETRLREKQQHIEKLHNVFESVDLNKSGDISATDFKHALEDPRLEGLLATLKLDVQDAKAVFDLLDRDKTGVVDRTEFVLGCLHLKGEAKTLDVVRLQAESASLLQHVLAVQQTLEGLAEAMTGQASESRASRGPPSKEPVAAASVAAATTAAAASPSAAAVTSAAIGAASAAVSTVHVEPLREHGSSSLSPGQLSGAARTGAPRITAVGGCCIEKTEERAMSLKELRALRREVMRRCEEEGWTDTMAGDALRPEAVNLYHLNHFLICPLTTLRGTALRGLPERPYQRGQHVEQKDTTGRQLAPLAEGVVEEVREDGSLCVAMRRGRFICDVPVTVDGVDAGEPDEVLSPGAISYKELVAAGPLKPRWFCCHWWGEPVMDFVACCEVHAKLRGLGENDASFWVCAYANCQHDLGADITLDPERSSFRRAMRLAEGVLLVLDTDATPFRRIWCDFELYKTISVDKKLPDIVTVHEGQPRLLSADRLPGETQHYKSLREQQFPSRLLVEGMRRRLEDGHASVALDKQNILESMARDGAHGEGSGHEERLARALREANAALHAYFALAAWSSAASSGTVEDFDREQPGTLSLPDILARDHARQSLTLSLAHSSRIQDHDARVLARGLPPKLAELHLSFAGCPNVTDAGIRALAEGLPSSVQRLALDFSNCKEVTDSAIKAIAEELPHGLLELDLYFAHCDEVGAAGTDALASSLPPNLARLFVTMRGTQVDRTFETPAALRRFASLQRASGSGKGLRTLVRPFTLGSVKRPDA